MNMTKIITSEQVANIPWTHYNTSDVAIVNVSSFNSWLNNLPSADSYLTDLELNLAIKTEEADGLRRLHEMLIKECYSLDPESFPDDGEYRYKWASLAITQTKERILKMEALLAKVKPMLEFVAMSPSIADRQYAKELIELIDGAKT